MALRRLGRFTAALLSNALAGAIANNANASAGTIVNDVIWKDNRDTPGHWYIKASYGGHITLIDGVYYWVGNDPDEAKNGADIHIYSSTTLGSSDWNHVARAVDVPAGSMAAGSNCRLLLSPATGKYVIVAKNGLMFYESSNVEGPYTLVRTLLKGQVGPDRGNWKIGGMSTFQDGNDAYVITSRRDLTSTETPPERRIGVYKLTPDFLDVESEVLWLRWDSREAMWLFKKGATYYMTASHTAGWSPSNCYYRTATSVTGPWSKERQIGMTPEATTKAERSHGSQCRWIMDVGQDEWVFAGDRYPYQSSEYDMSKGNYIFLPVSFDKTGHPDVAWKDTWQVKTLADIQV